MQPGPLWVPLWQLLAAMPGQNKRQLLAGLQRMGLHGLTTTDVNRTLYANTATFDHDGATPPRWRLTAAASWHGGAVPAAVPPALPRCYVGKEPRAWQIEALAAWRAHNRQGVVEAVTGTGKTTVGVLAAAAAVDAGERVLVLVPSRELLDQWYDVLQRDLHGVLVGRHGDGHEDGLDDHPIVIAIVNSAARYQMLPLGAPGLLVADEVHRYGSPHFARALERGFGARLGLTATYERPDNGLIDHLEPFFGGVVADCSYDRGLADEILAPFRVAFVGVDFTPDEQKAHDEYDDRVRSLRRRLIVDHGCPAEPFGEFMAMVNHISAGGEGDSRAAWDARKYLNAFNKRREVLAESRNKQEALAFLAPVLATADRGLVFGQTMRGAEDAAAVLRASGVQAMEITSGMNALERKQRLAAFRDGQAKVLAAPRLLDEGIDVPQADVGVIVAGSRSKLQMIQRMGRVIRPKADGRPATFIILYVRGTAEDPDTGAHEGFVEQIIHVAQEIERFDHLASGRDLFAWHVWGRQPK
ncbi:DNA repair helicase [Micromonospora sp. WMMA2032]|uniref:DEAD/DEAH box helicase n=1 Tax=Micromonospora sp. WMMA2032 TaxID=2039870 RepID=UPI000C0584EC|nr:DEAD/DEAH box helicase [Micromonospora sp. WMMA2032]ATO13232.1 DNA repair helicase [Micromonospora sp. WMMA2032]